MNLNYFIIAGEASGDLHASHLMRDMKNNNPDINFLGIGGTLMEKEGLNSLIEIDKMAVMGFWEVLKNLKILKAIEKKALYTIKNKNIDAIILVDYPGFNLRIAKKIKKMNPRLPIFYYISPQIWAWKENRINSIKKYIDKMIVIFKFELDWYKKRGVDVEFVGHPFLDIYKNHDRQKIKEELGLDLNKKYITLFPGSRKQEIRNHLPNMLQAIKDDFFKDFEVLLGQAITLEDDVEKFYQLDKINVIKNNPEKALAVADFAWVASGTSTLESVLLNTPIILVYKTSAFSWHLMKKFVQIEYAGMPNIIMNDRVVPELLQKDFNSTNLINETKMFFNDKSYQEKMLIAYQNIRNALGEPGASRRAAEHIINATS